MGIFIIRGERRYEALGRGTKYECKQRDVHKRQEYQSFQNIVKDRYGEEAYKSILAEVDKEMEAYRISDTMKHDFTIAPGRKPVTTINKIR